MKYGFVKTALCVPPLTVGAPEDNLKAIKQSIKKAAAAGAELIAFGELALCGSTCGSMFRYQPLLAGCERALSELLRFTRSVDAAVIIGLPVELEGSVYDCTAVIRRGKLEALIPADTENAFFDSFPGGEVKTVRLCGTDVPFGKQIIVRLPALGASLGVCVGEDFDRLDSFATECSRHGANLIVNPSASPALMYSYEKRVAKLVAASEKLNVGYAYVSTGAGESVSRTVYSGDKIIAELGALIAGESGGDILISEIDIEAVSASRRFSKTPYTEQWSRVTVDTESVDSAPLREFNRLPFVPAEPAELDKVMAILGRGIATRMKEIGTDKVIFGLSGGLDSTTVLVVCARAFEKLSIPLKNILAVTMSGPASGKRTQDNAARLIEALHVTGINVPISDAVIRHLNQIGHSGKKDVVYENAQARERAQILLDLANKNNALMLGTGDLSEIALGWSTYGGDQLAQYNPNSSLSKTMIRAMMRYFVLTTKNETAAQIVNDILATPISPELTDGQETEKLIGPYELHDFFLYNIVGRGCGMAKVLYLSEQAFPDMPRADIKKYLRLFVSRFFVNQFKRNFGCDGIQLSKFDLSGLVLNSDFSNEQWLKELDAIVD